MNKLKFIFLGLIITAFMLLLVSCTCVPHEFNWEVETVIKDATFTNGITKRITYAPYLSLEDPYSVVHSGETYIKFYEDKTLVFKPIGEDELSGTYTTKNNGLKNTTVNIVLENGEKIKATAEGGVMYTSSLMFKYKEDLYTFDDLRGYGETEYQSDVSSLINELREEYFAPDKLTRATLVYDGEYKLVSEDGKVLNLHSANNAVYAMKLTSADQLYRIDHLTKGDCFVPAWCFNSDIKNAIVTIYYIDPSRNDHKPLSELFYIPDDTDVESIITKTDSNGEVTENEITDTERIAEILGTLRNITVLRIPPQSMEFTDNIKQSIFIKTKDGEYYAGLDFCGGYIYIENYYWKPSDWPKFD